MKLFILSVILILIFFTSCSKNPVSEETKQEYIMVYYSVTLRIQGEDGKILPNSWIDRLGYGADERHYADKNGEIRLMNNFHVLQNSVILDTISAGSWMVHPEDSTYLPDFPSPRMYRGLDYPIFNVYCKDNPRN